MNRFLGFGERAKVFGTREFVSPILVVIVPSLKSRHSFDLVGLGLLGVDIQCYCSLTEGVFIIHQPPAEMLNYTRVLVKCGLGGEPISKIC